MSWRDTPRISELARLVDGRIRIHTPSPALAGMMGWLAESTIMPDAGDIGVPTEPPRRVT